MWPFHRSKSGVPGYVAKYPPFIAAQQLNLTFDRGDDPGTLYDYALQRYEEGMANIDVLDTKAESLAKAAGAIVLAAAFAIFQSKADIELWTARFSGTGILLALLATSCALLARRPYDIGLRPSVETMANGIREYHFDGDTKLASLKQLSPAIAQNSAVCARKSRWLTWSTYMLCFALIALAFAAISHLGLISLASWFPQ